MDLDIPRDRAGTFTPMLVPKGQRRLDGLDAMIISLYAGGMTVRDIQHHLASTLGTDLSHETISKITDQISQEVLAWQHRPLDGLYPVIYLDAIMIKVRDGAHVTNKAAHIAVGVDMDGIKHVLGIWVQASEGARFWAQMCAELTNRGIKDVLIVCCDGLTGLPEAIEATWPQATVQTCVVHLIRAATRFVSYSDRKAVAAALRPIYQAPSEEAAWEALETFEASELGQRYPAAVRTFTDSWERFTPFLAFPPMVRRVIYTTNAIESLNYQLRKVTRNRGHFPSDEAAVKLLCVKPRVLWRLVYLVPVVAGCDCSWRWVSGAQAASCSAGVRIPMAECGRVVLNQWTHSAVASTGGVDVLPGSLVADELGLVQRVERLGQSKAERNPL